MAARHTDTPIKTVHDNKTLEAVNALFARWFITLEDGERSYRQFVRPDTTSLGEAVRKAFPKHEQQMVVWRVTPERREIDGAIYARLGVVAL